jgi:hypothetical protein
MAGIETRARKSEQNPPLPTPDSPWSGLAPFDEISSNYFFGRAREIDELFGRICDRRITVLYGTSGLGKTSLLQAGLIPRLREKGYLPVRVRLAFDDVSPSLLAQVHNKIRGVLPSLDLSVAPKGIHSSDEVGLWQLYHDPIFGIVNHDGEIIHQLVLLFDQFEELETLGRRKRQHESETFMQELACLVENRLPVSMQYLMETDDAFAERIVLSANPARVLVSLRNDYLHWLERWKPTLPSLMESRMELRPLSGAQALQAVLEPGRIRCRLGMNSIPIIEQDAADAIVRFVARAKPQDRTSDLENTPPILSLICEQLNLRRLESPGQDQISREVILDKADDVLDKFYVDSLNQFDPAVRRLVEDTLVTEAGNRNQVSIETFVSELDKRHVKDPEKTLDSLVNSRLLAIEDLGGIPRVELTHEVLLPIAIQYRKQRQQIQVFIDKELAEAKLRTQRFKRMATTSLVVGSIVSTLFAIMAWLKRSEAIEQAKYAKLALHDVEKQKTRGDELLVKASNAYTTSGKQAWEDYERFESGKERFGHRSKWHESIAHWGQSIDLTKNVSEPDPLPRVSVLAAAASVPLGGIPAMDVASRVTDLVTNQDHSIILLKADNGIYIRRAAKIEEKGIFIGGPILEAGLSPSGEQFFVVREINGKVSIDLHSSVNGSQSHSIELESFADVQRMDFINDSCVAASFRKSPIKVWQLMSEQSAVVTLSDDTTNARFFSTLNADEILVFNEGADRSISREATVFLKKLSSKSEKRFIWTKTLDPAQVASVCLHRNSDAIYSSFSSPASTPSNETNSKNDLHSEIESSDFSLEQIVNTQLGTPPPGIVDDLSISPDGKWIVAHVSKFASNPCGLSTEFFDSGCRNCSVPVIDRGAAETAPAIPPAPAPDAPSEPVAPAAPISPSEAPTPSTAPKADPVVPDLSLLDKKPASEETNEWMKLASKRSIPFESVPRIRWVSSIVENASTASSENAVNPTTADDQPEVALHASESRKSTPYSVGIYVIDIRNSSHKIGRPIQLESPVVNTFFSSDSRVLYTLDASQTLRGWDLHTSQEIHLALSNQKILQATALRDGRILAIDDHSTATVFSTPIFPANIRFIDSKGMVEDIRDWKNKDGDSGVFSVQSDPEKMVIQSIRGNLKNETAFKNAFPIQSVGANRDVRGRVAVGKSTGDGAKPNAFVWEPNMPIRKVSDAVNREVIMSDESEWISDPQDENLVSISRDGKWSAFLAERTMSYVVEVPVTVSEVVDGKDVTKTRIELVEKTRSFPVCSFRYADATTTATMRKHEIVNAAFHPDCKRVVVVGSDQSVVIGELGKDDLLNPKQLLQATGTIRNIEFSSNGDEVCIVQQIKKDSGVNNSVSAIVSVINLSQTEPEAVFEKSNIQEAWMSRSGKRLLVIDNKTVARLFSIGGAQEESTVIARPLHRSPRFACFSPDEKEVFFAIDDSLIQWEPVSAQSSRFRRVLGNDDALLLFVRAFSGLGFDEQTGKLVQSNRDFTSEEWHQIQSFLEAMPASSN